MKNSKNKPLPKERNPLVQHLINRRGAGAHQKPKKVTRRDDKVRLRKDYLNKAA